MELPEFSCPVYTIDSASYTQRRYQYATTSRPGASMSPGAIICPQYPNADADVRTAILYAAANGLGVAARTGGHAYAGTSSTTSNNIQLDLSRAYTDWAYDDATGLLRVGISYSLMELNTKMKAAGLFMPTGQCYDVFIGGHAQTGGYGQLARAFGLFGDQIVSFELFLADGSKKTVAADSGTQADKDLFFAVLGGGPGNYGILTHITIRPFKDSDHRYPRAFKQVIPYDPALDHDVLVQLFNLVREWESAPGDYDFSFTVASAEDDFLKNQIGAASKDDFMNTFFRGRNSSAPVNVLLIYFQYSNLDNRPDTYDPTWCNKIKHVLRHMNAAGSFWERLKDEAEGLIVDVAAALDLIHRRDDSVLTPVSESVVRLWTYEGTREFNYPYLKNAQFTDAVATPDWAEWAATRIDAMVGRSKDGLMVFVQCQNFGGPNSAFTKNGGRNQTAYAWRNTTVGYNMDVFFDRHIHDAHKAAEDWQTKNIAEGVGPTGTFSTADHRCFWACHGGLDMSRVWPFYYSSAAAYARCCAVKQAVDPAGVFTCNTFVVGYTPAAAPNHLTPLAAVPGGANTMNVPDEGPDDAAFTTGHKDRAKKHAEEKGINAEELFRK
jgi:hypothetical protein